ncbi:hypothetical protein CHS0354_003746 [Potamilus streckersoni]|uniref:Uncharacterized protein n=1 Tax=Potamilus streckersoni TaxID=2493646 RepID=A0AAE0VYZ6_9BIVA|nr:hypothetical protein CHS0354_003746 [Potamilus streckersoni]
MEIETKMENQETESDMGMTWAETKSKEESDSMSAMEGEVLTVLSQGSECYPLGSMIMDIGSC